VPIGEVEVAKVWLKREMEAAMKPLVGDLAPAIHVDVLVVADYSDAEKNRAENALKEAAKTARDDPDRFANAEEANE
jgi:hypothetical protein